MDVSEKIELILSETASMDSFDPGFVYSVQEFYEQNDFVTERQEAALDNIIDRFGLS